MKLQNEIEIQKLDSEFPYIKNLKKLAFLSSSSKFLFKNILSPTVNLSSVYQKFSYPFKIFRYFLIKFKVIITEYQILTAIL